MRQHFTSPDWHGTHYVSQVVLGLTWIYLLLPSECWIKGMSHHVRHQ